MAGNRISKELRKEAVGTQVFHSRVKNLMEKESISKKEAEDREIAFYGAVTQWHKLKGSEREEWRRGYEYGYEAFKKFYSKYLLGSSDICSNCGRQTSRVKKIMTGKYGIPIYLCPCCDEDIAAALGELEDQGLI